MYLFRQCLYQTKVNHEEPQDLIVVTREETHRKDLDLLKPGRKHPSAFNKKVR